MVRLVTREQAKGNRWDRLLRTGATGWSLHVVLVFLCLATTHVPVNQSARRLGQQPSKKARTCPSEAPQAGPQVASLRRKALHPGTVQERLHRRSEFRISSFEAISTPSRIRLIAWDRRPDYLNPFLPCAPHSSLAPPVEPGPTAA